MADGPRFSLRLVERIEDLVDARQEAHADGHVCGDEKAELDAIQDEIYQMALELDNALGIATTLIRRGTSSPSARRRMAESGLRVMEGGKGDPKQAA